MYARPSRDGSASDWSSKRFRTVPYGQHHDFVAFLIRYHQETVARCDCKIAWPATAALADGNADQSPICFDIKDGYAVVSPIGNVDPIA